MMELLTQIFKNVNFNRMMFVLAVGGGTYYFFQEWEGWTLLNSLIFFVIGYVLVTFICFLWNKITTKDEYKKLKKECDKEWENDVRSFFLSLHTDVKNELVDLFKELDTDGVYYNKKYTSDRGKISRIQKISCLDYKVRKKNLYFGGYDEEPCVFFESKNGVYSITFDHVVCKEIEKILKDK